MISHGEEFACGCGESVTVVGVPLTNILSHGHGPHGRRLDVPRSAFCTTTRVSGYRAVHS